MHQVVLSQVRVHISEGTPGSSIGPVGGLHRVAALAACNSPPLAGRPGGGSFLFAKKHLLFYLHSSTTSGLDCKNLNANCQGFGQNSIIAQSCF